MVHERKKEVFSREIIRPSSPTPDRKRIHKLSFFDQLSPPIYLPLLYFYPNQDPQTPFASKTQLLKTSLSSALSKYYPLAGRIRDSFTVDCNDEGAVFLEARMNSKLAEILEDSPVDETLKLCFPDGLCYQNSNLSSPLTVQVTGFDCGGMALAVCLSHTIIDVSGMCSFVNYWAALASNSAIEDGGGVPPLHLEFNLAELYPPIDLPVTKTFDPVIIRCVSRRLVFDGSNIGKLKGIVAAGNVVVENPTRMEVVLAILHCSAIFAIRVCSGSLIADTELHSAVNLRSRVVPPVPASSVGNMASTFVVFTPKDVDTELVSFAGMIREAKVENFRSCASRSRGEELCPFVVETTKGFRGEQGSDGAGSRRHVFGCSSWCGFPFYEADFGWGKPVWVTHTFAGAKDIITMMDTRNGDGIEVTVCLEGGVMAAFETDEKLLSFCTINPGVIW
ncbi:unnamed protein product [Linum trigynum]|uniref:Uncharacterized protein n=1 Tax=Linum trigynum TaxID=586398 RepID=A0AAV2CUT2_9ROSI